MISKALLNNVKQYKQRDASMDQYARLKPRNAGLKLPQINNHNEKHTIHLAQHQVKYLKSRCNPLEEVSLQKKKSHSRMPSIEAVKSQPKLVSGDAKVRGRENLLSDYGASIHNYLLSLSEINKLSQTHLSGHKISGIYRAKMIDWMVEVLTAFKCADQTFFLAVNLMDRYFSALTNENISLELHELHITGIVCMFMASKYEDIYPLLMKTVFNKIGHKKISVDAIRTKELEILRALSFKVGSSPSSFEFLEKYLVEVLDNHPDKEFIHIMSIYLAKMSLHHENLCTKSPNLMGASAIYVALKICE